MHVRARDFWANPGRSGCDQVNLGGENRLYSEAVGFRTFAGQKRDSLKSLNISQFSGLNRRSLPKTTLSPSTAQSLLLACGFGLFNELEKLHVLLQVGAMLYYWSCIKPCTTSRGRLVQIATFSGESP